MFAGSLMKAVKRKLKIAGNIIEYSKCEKLLGLKIDSKVRFKTHMANLCQNASRKIHALARITPYMDLPKNFPF